MNVSRSIFTPECDAWPVRRRAGARSSTRRRGFTLVEVLATLLLVGIALPAIMRGFSISTSAGTEARDRSLAGALAESKLNELVAADPRTFTTTNGTFDNQPDFQWTATLTDWPQNSELKQLDVTVSWKSPGSPQSITVSTLVYDSLLAPTDTSGGEE